MAINFTGLLGRKSQPEVQEEDTLSTDLLNAAMCRNPVHIEYADKIGTITERAILPTHQYETEEGHTCVVAYCFLREAKRTFRLDRILQYEVLSDVIHWPEVGTYAYPAAYDLRFSFPTKVNGALPKYLANGWDVMPPMHVLRPAA